MIGYLPLEGRRRAVEIVFAAILLLTAAAVASDVVELQLLQRVVDGETVTDAQADANDSRQQLFGALQLLAMIAGAVVFIGWLFRAHGNLHWVAPEEARHKTGWAIWGWFVPILNFWRPKQMVNDVWRGAHDDEPGWLALSWWLLWVASWLTGRVASNLHSSEDIDELVSGSYWLIATDLMLVADAVLLVLIVRRATAGLDRRRDEAGTDAAPAPAAAATQEPSPA